MSTVSRVNFEPVRDVLPITRGDFYLADKTLSDPGNSLTLVDGEWMIVNSDYKLARAADVGSAGNLAAARSYPLWMERGRYDMQASGKAVILWQHGWEFDTRIFDAAAVVGGGAAAITAVDQPVKVASITIGTRVYCGLVGHGGSGDSSIVVGYVTRLAASNGGKLRIRGGLY